MPAPSKSTNPAFSLKATSYDRHAHVQADAAQWLAEWLPEQATDGRCLELGAGTGLFSQHLVERFAHVECSDLSPQMLQVCKERVPDAVCRVRDAWTPPKSRENWDYLASSSLLQWAPCPHTTMQQWSKLIREQGRLFLGFFASPSLPEMMKVLGEDDGPVVWRSPEQWGGVFMQAGYTPLRMEAETRYYSYESALHFWKSLHGTGATVSRQIKPSVMLRFFRDYESMFRDDDGVFATWTFCRVELEAPTAHKSLR